MSTLAVGLVACGRAKLDRLAPARQLYRGGLFRAAASHVSATCQDWFVISARHGLVPPDELLAPYDTAIRDLGAGERVAWARAVDEELRATLLDRHGPAVEVTVYVHAGVDYRQHLVPRLGRWAAVHVPLARLGIGEQLAWYRRAAMQRARGRAGVT